MYQGFNTNKNKINSRFNNSIQQNDQRFWLPLIAGAAIISAPFWFGVGKTNNNNNNCCPYPNKYYPQYYQQPYYPQPLYQQPYYSQPYPAVTETNYYYY